MQYMGPFIVHDVMVMLGSRPNLHMGELVTEMSATFPYFANSPKTTVYTYLQQLFGQYTHLVKVVDDRFQRVEVRNQILFPLSDHISIEFMKENQPAFMSSIFFTHHFSLLHEGNQKKMTEGHFLLISFMK